MKKILTFVIFTVIFAISSSISNAGLINNERRQKNQPNASTKTASTTKQTVATQKASNAPQNAVMKILKSNQKVVGYAESKYDLNRDRVLQEAEMKALLSDVVTASASTSGHRISSEFLNEFDVNKDGYIDRYEAISIKKNL